MFNTVLEVLATIIREEEKMEKILVPEKALDAVYRSKSKAALAEVMRETCEAISTILEEEQKEGSSLSRKVNSIIGSSNIDMVAQVSHLPAPGETVGDACFMTLSLGGIDAKAKAAKVSIIRFTHSICVTVNGNSAYRIDFVGWFSYFHFLCF